MITEIDIEKITPHPKNPRKNIGDLEELTKSIRTFGVLQNLTVVPDNEDRDAFTVVCGHRRLAAAKKAALPKVPCVIMEMDEREQVAVMLMENMQRSDLTLQEEAQGFQMMLDLGASIRDIVKKTGMSETKIRHRIKMNELDQDLLEEKIAGEYSINDLIALEQIKDIDRRNEVLEYIGTNNFSWHHRLAISDQKKEQVLKILEPLLPGTGIEKSDVYIYSDTISYKYEDLTKENLPGFLAELLVKAEKKGKEWTPAYFLGSDDLRLGFKWKPENKAAAQEDPEEARRRKETKERLSRLTEMREKILRAWEAGNSIITETDAKNGMEKLLMLYFTEQVLGNDVDDEEFLTAMGCELPDSDDDETWNEAVRKAYAEHPHKAAACIIIRSMMPPQWMTTWGPDGRYMPDDRFINTAKALEAVGYELSDDELDFLHGRSDLYLQEED